LKTRILARLLRQVANLLFLIGSAVDAAINTFSGKLLPESTCGFDVPNIMTRSLAMSQDSISRIPPLRKRIILQSRAAISNSADCLKAPSMITQHTQAYSDS